MGLIKRGWQGEERLWKLLLIGMLADGLYPILQNNIGRLALGLPFLVWLMVSMWRCAFNTESKILGYGSRAVVVFGTTALLLSIAEGVIKIEFH
jgi:hypothetical protein